MEFLLSRVGLLVVSAFLVAAVLGLALSTAPQADRSVAEGAAREVASRISTLSSELLPGQRMAVEPPRTEGSLLLEVSPESVRAHLETPRGAARGSHPLLLRVYPATSQWRNTSELREGIRRLTGAPGTPDLPISPADLPRVQGWFAESAQRSLRSPLRVARGGVVVERFPVTTTGGAETFPIILPQRTPAPIAGPAILLESVSLRRAQDNSTLQTIVLRHGGGTPLDVARLRVETRVNNIGLPEPLEGLPIRGGATGYRGVEGAFNAAAPESPLWEPGEHAVYNIALSQATLKAGDRVDVDIFDVPTQGLLASVGLNAVSAR